MSAPTELGYGLDDRGSKGSITGGEWDFSLHHYVQKGPETHPVSYPMGTGDSFPGVKST